MTELIKSDVFFFITAVAIVVVTIVILVALYYVIKILRDFEEISDIVKNESKLIAGDISFFRRNIWSNKEKIKKVIKKVTSDKKRQPKKK